MPAQREQQLSHGLCMKERFPRSNTEHTYKRSSTKLEYRSQVEEDVTIFYSSGITTHTHLKPPRENHAQGEVNNYTEKIYRTVR